MCLQCRPCGLLHRLVCPSSVPCLLPALRRLRCLLQSIGLDLPSSRHSSLLWYLLSPLHSGRHLRCLLRVLLCLRCCLPYLLLLLRLPLLGHRQGFQPSHIVGLAHTMQAD